MATTKLQQSLIKKIKNPQWQQADIAKEYSAAIQEYVINGQDLNWPVINRAIVDRWGRSGLKRVKEMAWKGNPQ
jgi:hypothetical protein